jgi:hypothetical protein
VGYKRVMNVKASTALASSVRRPLGTARPSVVLARRALALLALAVVVTLALDSAALGALSVVVGIAGGIVLAAALPLLVVWLVVSAFEA